MGGTTALLISNMKWVMLVSGVLTLTMLQATVDPQAALLSTFGATVDGPVAEIVVRNWGALIALMGAMLIYGAYHPHSRPLVLTVAGTSKLVFIALVLTYGSHLLNHQVGVAVVVDSAMVLLFLAYLFGARRGQPAV